MDTITRTIRIDYDIYDTIIKNSDAIQEQEDFSTIGEIYNMLLRLGLQMYLEKGNVLNLSPFLPNPPIEEPNETNETDDSLLDNGFIHPEARISLEDFHLLLKEGLTADLNNLQTFHKFAGVKVLSLFNNQIEVLTNGFTFDMLEPDDQLNVMNFISFFLRGYAYLLYIFYPSQLELIMFEILTEPITQHPFLYVINKTHYIDKDDIQIMLIKDLFQSYKDLELDLRLTDL